MLVGVVLGGLYGFLWALMFTAGEADDASMREWERQQAVWRGDGR